ncbi:hypothetical protein EDB81DRAFT_847659 [Dactylonectria macrodidyma]|uniref:Uncharacterized protein n=1 Tax=Dactylonectria macrodidyma TaxID=307937 RepID=A0A9P9DLU1_9HYPO|nr:hypothetical protein EDB81DRAFT_847659 [Dactylonectria macrodidyma]
MLVPQLVGLTHPRRERRQKFARHCKRYWWIHLAIFICSSILQVTLIIFVAVPKIAQRKMNGVKLNIDGMEIPDPKPDNYHLRVNSTAETDGKIKATVSPFEGVMYLEDFQPHTPFAILSFQKTNTNEHQVVNISQRFQANETTRLTINGRIKVQPKGLNRKYGVTFNKTFELKGLDRLKGVNLVESQLLLDQGENGPNLKGGNFTFANYIDNKEFSSSNLVNFTAKMDLAAILDAVRKKSYCRTGMIPLKLQAKSVKNNGQELEYLATVMGRTNQTVEADVGSMVENAAGIKDQMFQLARTRKHAPRGQNPSN